MVLYDEMVKNRMDSLADCMKRASEDGYNESFKVIGTRLCTENEKHFYEPQDVILDHVYKFEGNVAAVDDSVVYLIETREGRRGTLIDVYGPYANTKLACFIRNVDELKKKSEVKGPRSWKDFLRNLD